MGELEAFLAAAEELHFGRAAERLYVSPSRVSQLVRSLEGHIGGALFERTTRRVALTPMGALLERDLRQAYADLLAALERARKTARGLTGAIRIGYMTHFGDETFTRLVEEFRGRFPSVEITLVDLTGTHYHEELRDGGVDLALGRFHEPPPAEMADGAVMARESWLLGVGRSHPLAVREQVDVEELAGYAIFGVPDPLTGELANPLYPTHTPTGAPIARRGVARTFAEVLALVARGENVFPAAVSFPRFYTHPDVVFVPLTGWPPALRTLRHRTHGNTEPVEAFLELAGAMEAKPVEVEPVEVEPDAAADTPDAAPSRPGYGDWWGPRTLGTGLPSS
ncbi:LysR family transcriptional regulator [Streptacidiphilus jiangxiensis]|uniref:DNA-binding transcriptional regulator, LysR family n=1 Tax=Streptacidiphilus jiangxiensis TaxID=235985 RepID=A0A1H7YE25_STRJI|nr:LysR family transcriptional regulator [Streptacidiphilus jiangxiensis]SEM44486.1 DNA-binding transcriptional regulator, LysR family [Streptacidiphilus jiangxiensis]